MEAPIYVRVRIEITTAITSQSETVNCVKYRKLPGTSPSKHPFLQATASIFNITKLRTLPVPRKHRLPHYRVIHSPIYISIPNHIFINHHIIIHNITLFIYILSNQPSNTSILLLKR